MPTVQVADLVRVSMNFALAEAGTAVEQAELSTWWKSPEVPTFSTDWDAVLQEMATLAYARWTANVGNGQFHNSVSLSNTKVTHTNVDGTIQQEQVGVAASGASWVGGSTHGSLPWQTSLAVSLYAYQRFQFTANQRRKRGRVYLPPMSVDVLSDQDSGMLTPTLASTIAAEIGQYLQDIQQHTYTSFAGFTPVLGVNSRGPFKGTGVAPEFFPVTFISVDNKLDTQRRRTKSLSPTTGLAPYPHS